MLLKVCGHVVDGGLAQNARAEIRIELCTRSIQGDLEAAVLDVRQRVRTLGMRVMQPGGHFRRVKVFPARRRTEKENLLTRGEDSILQQIGKQLGQPRSAGKDKRSGGDRLSIAGLDGRELGLAPRRQARDGAAPGSGPYALLG